MACSLVRPLALAVDTASSVMAVGGSLFPVDPVEPTESSLMALSGEGEHGIGELACNPKAHILIVPSPTC